MKSTLFSDLHLRLQGHNYGFFKNIIDYIAENEVAGTFYFLSNAVEGIDLSPKKKANNIHLLYLTETESQTCVAEESILKKAEIEWQFIQKRVIENAINRLFLMEMDTYQIEIGKHRGAFEIAGIWMRPYLRIEPINGSFKEKLRIKIWKLQKAVIMRFCLRNPLANGFYILNDTKTTATMNASFRDAFRYLPDPIFDYRPRPNFNINETYSIDNHKVTFLLFGMMEGRKNVVNILKSFQLLSPEEAKKATLLLVGKTDPNYATDLAKALAETKTNRPELQIVVENRFVSNEEMACFFEQTDVSLRMNVNFFVSSGIVGMAAKYNKPSIVSDYGLVKDLIASNKLGVWTHPDDLVGIKNHIVDYLENPSKRRIEGQNFYTSHNTTAFVRTLLEK